MPTTNSFITPLLYAIPVQLLAYYAAIAKGTDVDQPRNLAEIRHRRIARICACHSKAPVWSRPMTDQNALKRAVAAKALEYVQDGMKLGLGSGSTAEIFVEMLAPRVRGGEKLLCVPTIRKDRRRWRASWASPWPRWTIWRRWT